YDGCSVPGSPDPLLRPSDKQNRPASLESAELSHKLLDLLALEGGQAAVGNAVCLPPHDGGKLANRDSGIDSISSPSNSEEICFGPEEGTGEGAGPLVPPTVIKRSSTRDSEGDSDMDDGSGDETELLSDLPPPQTEKQDSDEVKGCDSYPRFTMIAFSPLLPPEPVFFCQA
uniref:Uncharacterized protein n=1 Tax=Naja naja TaxID=35670 RepID=A0A8C6XXW6_NAJNA